MIACADFSKWRCVVFVVVTDEKINILKENAVHKTTKEARKMACNYFRGKNIRYRTVLNFISHKTLFYLNRIQYVGIFVKFIFWNFHRCNSSCFFLFLLTQGSIIQEVSKYFFETFGNSGGIHPLAKKIKRNICLRSKKRIFWNRLVFQIITSAIILQKLFSDIHRCTENINESIFLFRFLALLILFSV